MVIGFQEGLVIEINDYGPTTLNFISKGIQTRFLIVLLVKTPTNRNLAFFLKKNNFYANP
ncbi:hypothetical protein B7P33_11060 [Sediminicola luteus]|uniref:Uncharacterized protein n=1 Tax=Sediminicola luteus TaxID=319238 RepID=A0A2A4G5V0_9FLAO|nr:hypothetical protein B7P33_11060 [Sediminicola luteus]